MTNSVMNREQAESAILSVLPSRANDLARLAALRASQSTPVITVIGKYNHGKSRLLNELIGSEAFMVADKRETVKLSECLHEGVRWLDAPGLDADVASADDQYAEQAVWLESDIRLVVHAAKEGELDSAEKGLIELLLVDSTKTKRQNLFVLSQVDQLSDDSELEAVTTVIQAQVPQGVFYQVSATRHRQGIEENKNLFVQRSGIPTLKEALGKALAHVPAAREHETAMRFHEVKQELAELQAVQSKQAQHLEEKQVQQRQAFDAGLIESLDKVALDLEDLLAHTGVDHSLEPDSIDDIFKLTAGKLDRSRVHVAYSRAIRHLSVYLVQQGVIDLPSEQRVAASGLNTIMVAVLGISVKYRKDLRQMFFEQAGRERIQKDCVHYYELSADRVALDEEIIATKTALQATEKAISALLLLEADEWR